MTILLLKSDGKCRFLALGIFALVLLAMGCAGSVPSGKLAKGPAHARRSPPPDPPMPEPPPMPQQLEAMVARWDGTPHRLGGDDRSGIDCSGFVRRVYRNLFGIRLPRTAAGQVRTGAPIRQNRLRMGDLLFFRPPGKKHHVGIYMGGGRFAHASTSRGVTTSDLDNPYWRNAYWTARRLPEVSAHLGRN